NKINIVSYIDGRLSGFGEIHVSSQNARYFAAT
ncbi:MAG: hypothetical protein ACI861_002094, partial [Paracoccaceae bacterium]